MKQDVLYRLLGICGIAAGIGLISPEFGQPGSTAAPQAHATYMARGTSAGQAGSASDTFGADSRSDGFGRSSGYLWSELPPETVGVGSWVEQE